MRAALLSFSASTARACPAVAAPALTTHVCPTDEEEDEEEVYKMAGVMAPCGGLECMLNRLTGIKDFKQGRHLLTVSLPLAVGTGVMGWKIPHFSLHEV